jgi:23S rRNA A2030 N6-methylase RlmJ
VDGIAAGETSAIMGYDHGRKAGNKGDVWKHFALISVVDGLAVGQSFRYIDLHSGAPSYQLGESGEWKRGIAAVLNSRGSLGSHGYLEVASKFAEKGTYLSSWRFVVERLAARCPHLDVVLTDTADAVAARYERSLSGLPPNTSVRFEQSDGFRSIEFLAKADLVLIDPPFNPDAASEWRQTRVACASLLGRRIPFLAWYPLYSHSNPTKLVAGTGCSSWEVRWARIGPKPSQNIKGCGMLASADVGEILRDAEPELQMLASCLGGTLNKRSHAG